jgi:hypothetical protein
MQAISMTNPTVSHRSSVGTTEIIGKSSAGQPGAVRSCFLSRASAQLVHPRGPQIATSVAGLGAATIDP